MFHRNPSNRTLRLSFMAALLLCLVASAAMAQDKARVKHVVIVSFDQGAALEIKNADNMPTFHDMAKTGAHDWQAYTIVPSITLPSHTSMLTGVGIQAHQVDWNSYQPQKGLVKVPTIFSIAHEHAMSTGMYVGKEKFKHLLLPGSVDHFEVSGDALDVARAFARDLPKAKYNLCFLHFADIDAAGHAHGLHSPQWILALANTDAALKVVRDAITNAGMDDDTVVILTADHGGHNIKNKEGQTRGTHGTSKPEDVDIPWIAWGHDVKADYNITAPVVTYDTSATALWLLGIKVPESFWGRPVVNAFKE